MGANLGRLLSLYLLGHQMVPTAAKVEANLFRPLLSRHLMDYLLSPTEAKVGARYYQRLQSPSLDRLLLVMALDLPNKVVPEDPVVPRDLVATNLFPLSPSLRLQDLLQVMAAMEATLVRANLSKLSLLQSLSNL